MKGPTTTTHSKCKKYTGIQPKPTNESLKTLASKYEKYSVNNNVFNGRNISDPSK
jgi:hypothetical protein